MSAEIPLPKDVTLTKVDADTEKISLFVDPVTGKNISPTRIELRRSVSEAAHKDPIATEKLNDRFVI